MIAMSQNTLATIKSVIPLTDNIMQLMLVPEFYIAYQAGQYLKILIEDQALSYSIANAPLDQHYELHIRHAQNNVYNRALMQQIKHEEKLKLVLPFGECHINQLDPIKPILFIAAGTGFAPIKAIIEVLLATRDPRSFSLYWAARSQSDLYMEEKIRQWQSDVGPFKFASLLSGKNNKNNLASSVLVDHHSHLADYQAVIGGPFDMAYPIRDQLVAAGMPATQLFADAFNFE